jgi:transposase, IS5 family
MQAKEIPASGELFRVRLDAILNLNHKLIRLSHQIDWSSFDRRFGPLYEANVGRPGLPIRLMVGLTYLSRMYDLSDEAVVEAWIENPYWQYFCGMEYLEYEFPLDPSSLVRWRKRIGKDGVEFLLQQTVVTARHMGQLTPRHMEKVNVDTTVQEKAIRFPTDARLYHRMLERLVKAAHHAGVSLRQSYVRVSKYALLLQGKYAHARQMNKSRKQTKRLKTFLGCVVRDLRRKLSTPSELFDPLLLLADRLLSQERTSSNKLYSIHEPHVECIAKGKAHKKYEFGCKVSIVTTSRGNWVVGIEARHGNPYDGHTLAGALDQTVRLTGCQPKEAYCDRGYQGHGYTGSTEVHIVNRRKKEKNRTRKKWFKRRSAVEPIIGHLKSDVSMDRNFLKGKIGDAINAMLSGCGHNLRKLLGAFFRLLLLRLFIGRAKLLSPVRSLQADFCGSCLRLHMA